MKIAVLSNYRESSGYSQAAREMILSLDAAGATVAPRPIRMIPGKYDIPDRIKELENNDLRNVDAVIQYSLPDQFSYKSGIKNIGVFAYETDNLVNTGWHHYLDQMDTIIVLSHAQKNAIERFNRKRNNVFVSPVSIDIESNKDLPSYDFGFPKNCVKFYTIADLNRRKNLHTLIVSYLMSFDSTSNVVLVIKSSAGGKSAEEVRGVLTQLINSTKKSTRRFADPQDYPPIVLLTDNMPDIWIKALHNECDVFVTASHGESWCIPAAEALSSGNQILVPDEGVFKDYKERYDFNDIGMVGGHYTPVIGMDNVPPTLYTSYERWFSVDITLMTLGFNWAKNYILTQNSADKVKRSENAAAKWSRALVGKRLLEIITGKENAK